MDLVILSGTVGKGATWTQGCAKPLLPLPAQSTLLETLIGRLDSDSIGKCIICCDGHKDRFANRVRELKLTHLKIEFFEDNVPLGTAGCLKACESRTEAQTILLVGGSVWLDDDPRWMLEQHRRLGNALTVFCIRDSGWRGSGSQRHLRPAGVFCCDRSVLEHIRPNGFQDLKEQLVPALKRAGLRVGVVALRGATCEVSDPATYLDIIGRVLTEGQFQYDGFVRIAPDIWCGRGVQIAPRARLVGPVILGHDSKVEDGAVIVGPAMLGDRSHVGKQSRLIRVVAPRKLRIHPGMFLADRVLTSGNNLKASLDLPSREKPDFRTPPALQRAMIGMRRVASPITTTATVIFLAFLWAFWPSVMSLWSYLGANADYSAGQLVPVAALYMAASQKERWSASFRFWWPGLALFAIGFSTNTIGYCFRYLFLENLGIVTAAVGIIASILGRNLSGKLWFPLLSLFFMVPLPHRMHEAILFPLQNWGASIAVRVLETLGIPVVQAGNVMQVAGHQIAVAEACSGLRMVLAFLIVAAVIAYVIDRPVWQKVIVLFSSIPIALFCNIVRLVLSAYLISIGRQELAEGAFHDGAGMIMMPVAIALVFFEFWLLSNLMVPQGGVAAIVEVVDDRMQRATSVSGG